MIEVTGNDGTDVSYSVPSASKPGETWDVLVNLDTLWVTCNCEDAVFHRKGDNLQTLLDGNSISYCRHMILALPKIKETMKL